MRGFITPEEAGLKSSLDDDLLGLDIEDGEEPFPGDEDA
jgi:hypothetical protein